MATIFAGGALLLYASFSGGVDGVLKDLKPAPDPGELLKQRQAAKRSLTASHTKIHKAAGLQHYGTGTHDQCFSGQHNFKVDDPYAHRCEVRSTSLYGFDGDFASHVLALHQTLVKEGWAPSDTSLTDVIAAQSRIELPDRSAKRQALSGLPRASYEKAGQSLEVRFVLPAGGMQDLEYFQRVSEGTFDVFFEERRLIDAGTIFHQISNNHDHIAAIAIQRGYFQN